MKTSALLHKLAKKLYEFSDRADVDEILVEYEKWATNPNNAMIIEFKDTKSVDEIVKDLSDEKERQRKKRIEEWLDQDR